MERSVLGSYNNNDQKMKINYYEREIIEWKSMCVRIEERDIVVKFK